MTQTPILIYGADWCGDCRRARRFLQLHQIPFEWIDIEKDKAAEQVVLETNHGMRSIPTVFFEDGTFLVEPSNRELAHKLNIQITPV
jgi:glutaredoxin-like protein